jgi:hypothetical protein
MSRRNKKPGRQYPPVYEKIVPIALGLIGMAIIILLVITILVALGVLS